MIGFNLNKTKRHFTEMLAEQFPQREAEQLMHILLEDFFNIDLTRQLMEPKLRLDEEQYAILENAVKRLLEGEPVQYVTGLTHFNNLLIKVSPSVLIPRPETEELVGLVADELAQRRKEDCPLDRPLRIWDVGTGSGCIAIALAKRFHEAEVIAFDVSEQALEVASQNAEQNGVEVDFVCDDVLHPHSGLWQQPVDLVVSNPPYVCESEKASMERNVLDYEPFTALFVSDDDPLLYYRQILLLANPQLSADGTIWFEINEALGEDMIQLCHKMGFEAVIHNDFLGKPRFLSVKKCIFANQLSMIHEETR